MFDGGDHQVVALAGTSVRLWSAGGAATVVLAAYLMASPGFAVVDGAPVPAVEPFGLLDDLPGAVIDAARVWERHVGEADRAATGCGRGSWTTPWVDPARRR